jgi:hypothetical protein
VTDTNGEHAAADAWEQTQAPAADADQKAVAAANQTGGDALAAAARRKIESAPV